MKWQVVLLVLLAACASPDVVLTKPELEFQTVRVITTPIEAFELQGTNLVHYPAGDTSLVGFYTEFEDAMPRYVVRSGETWYASQFQRGWTEYDLLSQLSSNRAYRYELWDLARLYDSLPVVANDPLILRDAANELQVTEAEGVWNVMRLQTSRDVESPYEYQPWTQPFPFSVKVPKNPLTPSELAPLENAARDAHAKVIGWLQDYEARRGTLPEEVNAQALAFERAFEAWPSNPFTGTPLAAGSASGDFVYRHCGGNHALYVGYGFDASSIGESFGASC